MHIIAYINGTQNTGIVYESVLGRRVRLEDFLREKRTDFFEVFCDSSFASEKKERSRYGFFFFCLGSLVSWTSSVSTRVLTSSTEAECYGLVKVRNENIWQREFLSWFHLFQPFSSTLVWQDNQSDFSEQRSTLSQKESVKRRDDDKTHAHWRFASGYVDENSSGRALSDLPR